MMNDKLKKRLTRIALLSLIAMIVGGGMAVLETRNTRTQIQNKESSKIAGIEIGGDYTLIDHTGNTSTQDTYKGQYQLIYFGFTACPEICPTELQKMSQALEMVGTPNADKIQSILITIDPVRDTVETLANYVPLFHPRLVGLTGTEDEIDDVIALYRIYAKKVDEPDLNEYTMDHSSYIYLMNPSGELVSIYKTDDNAEYMAEDIASILAKT